MMSVP